MRSRQFEMYHKIVNYRLVFSFHKKPNFALPHNCNFVRDLYVYFLGYSIFDKQMNRFDHLNDINNNRCKCLPACTHILYNYETVELFKNWTSNSKIL